MTVIEWMRTVVDDIENGTSDGLEMQSWLPKLVDLAESVALERSAISSDDKYWYAHCVEIALAQIQSECVFDSAIESGDL